MCRKYFSGIAILLIGIVNSGHAQNASAGIILSSIDPHRISISTDMTTNIIFPFGIKSVDRGSVWVLAQQAKGTENVLQLKAGRKEFTPTNVTVITSDAELHSFLVEYASVPPVVNIKISRESHQDSVLPSVRLADLPLNEKALDTISSDIAERVPFMKVHRNTQLMRLWLKGIYLQEDLMWFSLQLKNYSSVNFSSAAIRFFVKETKKAKRTAIQEKEVLPVFHPRTAFVAGRNDTTLVYAFSPLAVPRSQHLIVQVMEGNGGRRVSLRIKSRKLLKAKFIK